MPRYRLGSSSDTSKIYTLRTHITGFEMISSLNDTNEIIINEDRLNGIVVAISLLFSIFRIVQEKSSTVKSNGPLQRLDASKTMLESDVSATPTDKVIFDANDWIEMSKPENYIPYSNKLRQTRQSRLESAAESKTQIYRKEKRIVVFLLMALFIPIFSIELFFALSRQFMCGNYLTQIDDAMWLTDFDRALSSLNAASPWAAYMCSPHYLDN